MLSGRGCSLLSSSQMGFPGNELRQVLKELGDFVAQLSGREPSRPTWREPNTPEEQHGAWCSRSIEHRGEVAER